jgi:CRISPR system Cascade subunit CasA
MFSLLENPWLPARRTNGQVERIRPAEITAGLADNPVVAIEWPRPDFRLATLEFLIGLLATACPPRNVGAWVDFWQEPPSPESLTAAFQPFAAAFYLDGNGPRFLQDYEDLPGEPDLPETLLIEAPGAATRRNNATLLVKPDRVHRLSRAAAAMTLFTLQTYAPAGGRGNLTSVRGGGPLTTLALPGAERPGRPVPLWHILWANVPQGRVPPSADLPRIFPWLAPTRGADLFPTTTPAEAHPLQAFWGMPRRIRLDFAANPDALPCDLTGDIDTQIVIGWRQRPNGVKYIAWDHPLSPSYNDGKGEWLPMHPQPGGIGYRHWLALTLGDGANRKPAPCIPTWFERASDVRAAGLEGTRLLAAGYDMDNMKARAFIESEMPLPGSGTNRAALADLARGLSMAAEEVARALRYAIREACYSEKIPLDAAPLATPYEAFWSGTQDAFFAHLGTAGATLESVAPKWHRTLRKTALALFDQAAPLDPSAVSFDPARIVKARNSLFLTLSGYGAVGTKIFAALELPRPETAKAKAARGKAKEPA